MANSERFQVSFLYYLLLKVLILRDFSHFSMKLHHQFSPISFCRPSKNPVLTVLSKVCQDSLASLARRIRVCFSRQIPVRIRAHPRGAFNSVGACTPTEYSLCNNEPKSHRKLACEGDLGDCRTPKGFALRCSIELKS